MPPTTTHPTDAELSAFALGKPVTAGDSWIEEHLAGCEECQQPVSKLIAFSPTRLFRNQYSNRGSIRSVQEKTT